METLFADSLTLDQQQEHERFWKNSRHAHPRQHYVMAKIEAAIGYKVCFATGRVNNQIVITALFCLRPLWGIDRYTLEAMCIDGPIFDEPTHLKPFLEDAVGYFKRIRVGQMMISPYWLYPEADNVKAVMQTLRFSALGEPMPTGIVDLDKTEDELLMSFSKKARKEIRKGQDENIEIRLANTLEEVRDHFDCYKAMRLERNLYGIRPLSWAEFSATYNCLKGNPELGEFVLSWHNRDFLAGRFILSGPATAFGYGYAINYQIANRVRNVSVGCSLFWRGFCWAKSKGCRYFDMEGYDEKIQEGNALFAVYQFKQRFNPRQVYRLEPFTYRCNSITYSLLKIFTLFQRVERRLRGLLYSINNRVRRRTPPQQHARRSESESILSDSETS